jgi:hypothetical protein
MTIHSDPQGQTTPLSGLFQAAQQAASQGLADSLSAIYGVLPDTSCARRGFCCSLLPPLHPAEMLAWLHRQAGLDSQARAAQVARLVEHFLLNAAVRRPCPWALPRSCAVYEQRFFACRSYGLWSPKAYDARREAALAAQTQVAQAWSRLGVELPAEVLAPGPGYCGQVRQIAHGENRPITGQSLGQSLERAEANLAGLTRGLPDKAGLLACGGDLSYLLARLALGEGPCLAAKVEVTRALLEGRAEEAADTLNQCLNKATNWSLSWPDCQA